MTKENCCYFERNDKKTTVLEKRRTFVRFFLTTKHLFVRINSRAVVLTALRAAANRKALTEKFRIKGGKMKSSNLTFPESENTADAVWQKISYELWSSKQSVQHLPSPDKRIVDLYAVVRSVINNDLSESEQLTLMLYWFDGLSVEETAQKSGVSKFVVYHSLNRAKEKIRHVLKHIVDCEIPMSETNFIL